MDLLEAAIVGAVALSVLPGAVRGQPGPSPGARIVVEVRQVAGRSVYLDLGTHGGLRTGDTLGLAVDTAGPAVGRVAVVAATEERSVLSLVRGAPALRGGQKIALLLRGSATSGAVPLPVLEGGRRTRSREPDETVRSGGPEGAAGSSGRRRTVAAEPFARRARGSVVLDLAALRSATRFGRAGTEEVSRTFATPAVRVSLTVPDAAAGLTLHTRFRAAYRYAAGDLLGRPLSVRVGTASLERRFVTVPLRVEVGRFRSRHERFSGYWDGLSARLGGEDLGAGLVLGFRPRRGNEEPDLGRPAVTAFGDLALRGASWRWDGELSGHWVAAGDRSPGHVFVGATQRLRLGALRLVSDVRVDRGPSGGARLSTLRLQGSAPLGSRLRWRASLLRRSTYREGFTAAAFGPRLDRATAGLSYGSRGRRGSADLSLVRGREGGVRVGGSASVGLPLPARGAAIRVAGSFHSGEGARIVSLAPAVSAGIGAGRARIGYRVHRSASSGREPRTVHAGDGSVDVSLRPDIRLLLRGGLQWAGGLRRERLEVSLRRTF